MPTPSQEREGATPTTTAIRPHRTTHTNTATAPRRTTPNRTQEHSSGPGITAATTDPKSAHPATPTPASQSEEKQRHPPAGARNGPKQDTSTTPQPTPSQRQPPSHENARHRKPRPCKTNCSRDTSKKQRIHHRHTPTTGRTCSDTTEAPTTHQPEDRYQAGTHNRTPPSTTMSQRSPTPDITTH